MSGAHCVAWSERYRGGPSRRIGRAGNRIERAVAAEAPGDSLIGTAYALSASAWQRATVAAVWGSRRKVSRKGFQSAAEMEPVGGGGGRRWHDEAAKNAERAGAAENSRCLDR